MIRGDDRVGQNRRGHSGVQRRYREYSGRPKRVSAAGQANRQGLVGTAKGLGASQHLLPNKYVVQGLPPQTRGRQALSDELGRRHKSDSVSVKVTETRRHARARPSHQSRNKPHESAPRRSRICGSGLCTAAQRLPARHRMQRLALVCERAPRAEAQVAWRRSTHRDRPCTRQRLGRLPKGRFPYPSS